MKHLITTMLLILLLSSCEALKTGSDKRAKQLDTEKYLIVTGKKFFINRYYYNFDSANPMRDCKYKLEWWDNDWSIGDTVLITYPIYLKLHCD